MNTYPPKSIAFFLAISLTVFLTVDFIFINRLLEITINWLLFLIFFISCFLTTFFLTLFFNQYFISNKIKEILLTIYKYRGKKNNHNEENKNLLDELNIEVSGWAQDRKNEMEQLKKLELYRKEFLGNVSHELKTPIFNIQGYILTLIDGGLEDPSINKDYLIRAEKSVDRMISIVEDLGAISQLEIGELELEQERFDIVALVKDIFESQEMEATGKGIILSLQDNSDKTIYAIADKFRIRQVLTNLVVNSIKYGKEYGETKVNFCPNAENVTIEIVDNGIGIGKEHLARLFERFYRVDKSRSREQGGTGLGLSIVKHIIEAHNQTIDVRSTEGEGSVFSFTLRKG